MTRRPGGTLMSLRADTVQALGEAGVKRARQDALGHAVKGVTAVSMVMVSTPFAIAVV